MAGPGTFRLWIGFGEKPLDDTRLASDANWVDVTDDVRSANFSTSTRRAQFDTFAAGTAVFVLDNQSRTYAPGFTTGTYYGDFTSNVPMRVTAEHSSTRYTVWRGTSRSWSPSYTGVFDSVTTVTAEDHLGLVSRYELSQIAAAYAGDTTADRVGRVLDDIGTGFPSAWRDLGNAGSSTSHGATTWGVNAYKHLADVTTADGGVLYADRDGTITHDGRNAPAVITRQNTSQQTFSHDTEPTYLEAKWSGVGTDYRDLVRVSGITGNVQQVDNTTTDDAPVVFQRLGTSIENDSAAAAAASYYADLYQTDRMFPNLVTLRIATGTSDVRTSVIPRQLRDRVTVELDPPGSGSDLSSECLIDGISHRVTMDDWQATYTLSSADQFDGLGTTSEWMVVGDATRGKVGTGRVAS